ncbi:uncharacterized protein BJX67DRAFT_46028 [Aspergillus lucknowensis]|uniref:Uncharacterized protein n=1 Tax=Aspergillus lucknowensis TaxID=176173 RepID=A0ABR4LVN8_9EURO
MVKSRCRGNHIPKPLQLEGQFADKSEDREFRRLLLMVTGAAWDRSFSTKGWSWEFQGRRPSILLLRKDPRSEGSSSEWMRNVRGLFRRLSRVPIPNDGEQREDDRLERPQRHTSPIVRACDGALVLCSASLASRLLGGQRTLFRASGGLNCRVRARLASPTNPCSQSFEARAEARANAEEKRTIGEIGRQN